MTRIKPVHAARSQTHLFSRRVVRRRAVLTAQVLRVSEIIPRTFLPHCHRQQHQPHQYKLVRQTLGKRTRQGGSKYVTPLGALAITWQVYLFIRLRENNPSGASESLQCCRATFFHGGRAMPAGQKSQEQRHNKGNAGQRGSRSWSGHSLIKFSFIRLSFVHEH